MSSREHSEFVYMLLELLVRRLRLIFWLNHGANIAISRQIGMPHLVDTWMPPHKHYGDVFFLCVFSVLGHNSDPLCGIPPREFPMILKNGYVD